MIMKISNTDIGKFGESLAAKFLKKQGYKILEKNLHKSHNELDLVAVDKNYIVFVEVKTRSVVDESKAIGVAASAVNRKKQQATVNAATKYLRENIPYKYREKQPRMDVIEVYLDKESKKLLNINHITNAFGIN